MNHNNENLEIRWQQRFDNYRKALEQLTKFLHGENVNELEEQGLIQVFEYTHELAWKTLKDFLESRGVSNLYGSKDVTRQALSDGLIQDGFGWMEMINSRNKTSHTYNEDVAREITGFIRQSYFQLFVDLKVRLEQLYQAL